MFVKTSGHLSTSVFQISAIQSLASSDDLHPSRLGYELLERAILKTEKECASHADQYNMIQCMSVTGSIFKKLGCE